MNLNLIRSISPMSGEIISNRYQVKRFRTSEALHTFLCTGSNALEWRELRGKVEPPLPSGYYRQQVDSQGVRFINTKTDAVRTITH